MNFVRFKKRDKMKKIWFLLLLSVSLVYAQTAGQTQAVTSVELEDDSTKQNVQSQYVKDNIAQDNRNERKVQKNENAKLKAEHRIKRLNERVKSRESRTQAREARKAQRAQEREARKNKKNKKVSTKEEIKKLASPNKKEV